jgi:hypothetical protein
MTDTSQPKQEGTKQDELTCPLVLRYNFAYRNCVNYLAIISLNDFTTSESCESAVEIVTSAANERLEAFQLHNQPSCLDQKLALCWPTFWEKRLTAGYVR